jgi:hypothetical protein
MEGYAEELSKNSWQRKYFNRKSRNFKILPIPQEIFVFLSWMDIVSYDNFMT